jgi:hypothetical protein
MRVLWTIALPVFGVIFAGHVVGRFRLLGDGGSQALNSAALPVLAISLVGLALGALAMAGSSALAAAAELVV